jgi:hypothetical protein
VDSEPGAMQPTATDRLEAALERIARAAAAEIIRAGRGQESPPPAAPSEAAARLDALIARLRASLAESPAGRTP